MAARFPSKLRIDRVALRVRSGPFSSGDLAFYRADVTDWDVLSPFSFEANLTLVLLFSMLEFGPVSCYGCSFVWIFCIRLAMFSFCVTYLFLPDVEIWPKKKS